MKEPGDDDVQRDDNEVIINPPFSLCGELIRFPRAPSQPDSPILVPLIEKSRDCIVSRTLRNFKAALFPHED